MSSLSPPADPALHWAALLGALAIVAGPAAAADSGASWQHEVARFSSFGGARYADPGRDAADGFEFRQRAPFTPALAGAPTLLLTFRDDREPGPRNFAADLKLGLRLEFPDSRGESHGPWFLQFKISRRAPEIRASIPVPRHTAGSLTLGTEF